MILVAMSGAALGFLQYNFNPAKIFMGDTGSMLLGYTMAVVAVLGLVKTAATVALIVPIIALGVPILDTFVCYCASQNERRSDISAR